MFFVCLSFCESIARLLACLIVRSSSILVFACSFHFVTVVCSRLCFCGLLSFWFTENRESLKTNNPPSPLLVSCLVSSCLVLFCLVLSCRVLSCLACLALPCLVSSSLVLSGLVVSCAHLGIVFQRFLVHFGSFFGPFSDHFRLIFGVGGGSRRKPRKVTKKTRSRRLLEAILAPRYPNLAPRWGQDGAKMSNLKPKMAQDSPTWLHFGTILATFWRSWARSLKK